VYFSNRLAEHLRTHFPAVNVVVTHREEGNWPATREAATAGIEAERETAGAA
jgi:hypothetical protein